MSISPVVILVDLISTFVIIGASALTSTHFSSET